MEMHGWELIAVASDALVLMNQAISIHITDQIFII